MSPPHISFCSSRRRPSPGQRPWRFSPVATGNNLGPRLASGHKKLMPLENFALHGDITLVSDLVGQCTQNKTPHIN